MLTIISNIIPLKETSPKLMKSDESVETVMHNSCNLNVKRI